MWPPVPSSSFVGLLQNSTDGQTIELCALARDAGFQLDIGVFPNYIIISLGLKLNHGERWVYVLPVVSVPTVTHPTFRHMEPHSSPAT